MTTPDRGLPTSVSTAAGRALLARYGVTKPWMAEQIAAIEAEAAAPLESALRALVEAWDRLGAPDDGEDDDPDDAVQAAFEAARAALEAVGE